MGRIARCAIPGAGRFQRRHALVEVRRVRRSGARLERADPLFERSDGRALAVGLGAERFVRLSRLRFESAQSIFCIRPVGLRGQKRIAGAKAEHGNDDSAHRTGQETSSASARRCFGGGTGVSTRFGPRRIPRRYALVRFARCNFSLNDLRLASGVTIDRGARWPSGNVLYFLVDHRLALSGFRAPYIRDDPREGNPPSS